MWPLIENSQAVHLVKPNVLYRPGPSIRKDYGLAYELRPGLFKRAKDRQRMAFRRGHGCLRNHAMRAGVCTEKMHKS